MKMEWTVKCKCEFPEEALDRFCAWVQKHGWDDHHLNMLLWDEIYSWEDEEGLTWNWGAEQTKQVLDEVQRRMGGVQLSMFDEVSNR